MILVTGAKGFIGRHVCSVLSARNKNLVALDRKDPNGSPDKPPYFSVECDIRDQHHIEQIVRRHSITTIVHLASLLNTASRKNPLDAAQINVLGSLNILEAACRFHVSKVIYASSISVYGSKSTQSQEGVPETEPAAPEDVYGAAKRYVEIAGDAYRQQFGIQFIVLRIASVIGPGSINTASRWRSDIFKQLGRPHSTEVVIPYRRSEALPFVHVEDVAAMVECLVDTEQTVFAVYNTPSETWVLNELASYVESLDKNIQFTFGQSRVSGIPSVISGQRFMTEFRYTPISLSNRLQDAAQFGL